MACFCGEGQRSDRRQLADDLGRNLPLGDVSNEVGEPIAPSTYQRLWKNILKAAGLPAERQKMRPYDARRAMATLLLSERAPTKVVSARLGQASTATTEDVYSRVLEAMQDQATSDLERAIFGGSEQVKKA